MLTYCFYLIIFTMLSMGARAQEFHPRHLFVKMKNEASLPSSTYVKTAKMFIPGLYLLETDELKKLEKEVLGWNIEYVQRDYLRSLGPLPEVQRVSETSQVFSSKRVSALPFNDEFINRLWSLDGRWSMNVSLAYTQLPSWQPEEIIVAVLDTGVDYLHEDLRNSMWINTKEIPGDGIDNDGNGYVDDVYGINTISRSRFTRRASGDPMGSHWHGTHVAGTIAAEVNNGLGISGIAHNAKIMAIRTIPDASNEADSNVIESLLYAARHGAKVINCSFGKNHSEGPALRDVIDSIGKNHGVLVVAASGNNSAGPMRWHNIDLRPQYPASLNSSNLLTIAATNNKGEPATFSNIGPKSVDLAAPGTNIFSTVKNNKYTSSSGTSMAAPHASGAAALILGYYPHLTPKEVIDILTKTAKHSTHLEGKIKTPGIIDLAGALRAAREYRK